MTTPTIEFAYPVAWPAGRRRTPAAGRKPALWKHQGGAMTFDVAMKRLRDQVNAMTRQGQDWRVLEQTLSTNFELRTDGRPRRDRGAPADPGVAFFFELDGKPHVLACDRWSTVQDNIAALPPPERWWQVMKVSANATCEQINAAWRALARDAHPDRPNGSHGAMARLNTARDTGLHERAGT